jgi:tetratricopeptide (TPR) repeat protein
MPSRLRLHGVIPWLFAFLMLGALPPAAGSKDTWIEVRSPNFRVISNGGEKEARKVADQFEQFREVFHTTFPKLRVDLGKPLIIFAVKNEDSLKALIPAYWEGKGRAHPAGIYLPGEDRHYVAVRIDAESDNPYHVVYHEYTHAILNLNFRGLPVWLNEGLAEYFGNSAIHDKDVEIGKIAPYHLQTLRQERLIPIDTLLLADERSPYYNEQNHASMFYAESWAIVHYLMLDPEARKRQLLATFMSSWDASGNQLEAAQKTFGDLKKFESVMDAYARQPVFYVGKVTAAIHSDPKSYSSRVLPDAEVDAQRALIYAHTQRPKEALAAVEEALKAEPNLALAYEAQGFLAYSQQEFLPAEEAFARAIELQTSDYFPYYFAAEAQLRNGRPSEEQAPKIIAYLEKAIQMNPQFAPAYAALASVYSVNPATRDKALTLGAKAALLEPGNLFYATNYGYVLANAGKTAEAKTLALRIQQAAKTPVEQANAQQLLTVIASREAYDNRLAEMNRQASKQQAATVVVTGQKNTDAPASGAASSSSASSKENSAAVPGNDTHRGESEYAVEGNVAAADCEAGPGKISISVGKSTMNFRFPDFVGLQVLTTAKQDSDQVPACASWKGRRVRLYFYKVKDKQFTGDLNTIQFL